MRRIVQAIVLLAVLCGLMAIAEMASSLPPQMQQDPANEWILWDASGNRLSTGTCRGYVDSADSSLAANQVVVTYTVSCSCWTPASTMVSGDSIRSTVLNIYRITGVDTLLARVNLVGYRAATRSVDNTALDTGAVDSRAVEDSSLSEPDYGDTSIPERAMGDLSVPKRALQSTAVDSTKVPAASLSGSDLFTRSRVAAANDSLLWLHPDGGLSRGPIPASYITGPMLAASIDALTKQMWIGKLTVGDSLGVAGDIYARGDVYVGNAGTEILWVDNIRPLINSDVVLDGGALQLGQTGGSTGELKLRASDNYLLSLVPRSGMGANKSISLWSGTGSANQVSVSDGSGPTWSSGLAITTLTTSGNTTIGNGSDKLVVQADSSRFENPLYAGGNGKVGTIVAHDGTGNKNSIVQGALSADITTIMPQVIAKGSFEYSDATATFHQALYIPGILATDRLQATVNEICDDGSHSSIVVSRIVVGLKSDSLVATAATSTAAVSYTIDYEISR